MARELRKVYVELSPHDEEVTRAVLNRTMWAWNAVVESLTGTVDDYFKEPLTDESNEAFGNVVDAVTDVVVFGDPKGLAPDVKLEQGLRSQMQQVRALPEETIRARIRDLKRCYATSKKRLAEGKGHDPCNYGIPGKKDKYSTKTARFYPGDKEPKQFSFHGEEIRINTGIGIVTVSHPSFAKVDIPNVKAVSLSNKAPDTKTRQMNNLPFDTRLYSLSIFTE
jgi:hypothetical protein